MPVPASLLALLPAPAPSAPGLPTGIGALDDALGGGLQRGRLTEVIGAGFGGSGRTTLLRRIVEATVAAPGGGAVAWIDASRTLAPRDWAHLGDGDGLWVIRPPDAAKAAWCADLLLRSGAFALVVLDSGPPLPKAVAVRLTRLARDAGAALVVTRDEGDRTAAPGSSLGTAARLRIAPAPERRRGFTILVDKGGPRRTVEVGCAIAVARRLCSHPQVPDRRGVAQRATGRPGGERRPAPAAVPGHDGRERGTGDAGHLAASLPRKRRCAEPEYGREHGAWRGIGAARAPRPAARVPLGASRVG